MREIKYRAYDKTRKRIWQVTGIGFQNGVLTAVSVYVQETETIGYSIVCYPSDVILLQYLGKDKAGNEVYEDDWLRDDDDLFYRAIYNNENWSDKIVIGNIYCKPVSEMNDQELEEYADNMRSWALCDLEEEGKE